MAAKSYYLSDYLLSYFLGNNALIAPISTWPPHNASPPPPIYVGLFNTLPATPAPGGAEVSGAGYVRIQISFSTVAAPNYASNIYPYVSNTGYGSGPTAGDLKFPVAASAWGTIVGAGIFDAPTSPTGAAAGNLLYYGAIGIPVTVNLGDQVAFTVGSLVITEL